MKNSSKMILMGMVMASFALKADKINFYNNTDNPVIIDVRSRHRQDDGHFRGVVATSTIEIASKYLYEDIGVITKITITPENSAIKELSKYNRLEVNYIKKHCPESGILSIDNDKSRGFVLHPICNQ